MQVFEVSGVPGREDCVGDRAQRNAIEEQARASANHEIVALAGDIVSQRPLPAAVAAQTPTKSVVTAWAQGAHAIGMTLVYPRLTIAVAAEPASAAMLASCAGNHDVVRRMLAKHEVIDAHYEQASIPAIVGQIRLAGVPLATVLKAAYPNN